MIPKNTYLVGGAVRDRLLGLAIKDRDWLVVGSTPEAMQAAGFLPVGRDFPVFLHPTTHEEYALARTERKSGSGYRGFVVHTSPDVTLEEDLARTHRKFGFLHGKQEVGQGCAHTQPRQSRSRQGAQKKEARAGALRSGTNDPGETGVDDQRQKAIVTLGRATDRRRDTRLHMPCLRALVQCNAWPRGCRRLG